MIKNKKLSKEEEEEVIDLYQNSNMSIKAIANNIGYKSNDVVYKILKDNNIQKRRSVKKKVSITEEGHIINLYQEGKSMRHIGQLYNVSSGAIKLILEENGIKLRETIKKYTLKEDYFDFIDTKNKAYILGFLYADGFIRKDNLVLSVVVHNKDIDILHKIKKELDCDSPIEHIENKNHNRINICSKYLCESLNKLGCSNGKTFHLKFPTIDEELVPHFIRGFMDGDGCISVSDKGYGKYFSLSFTGTEEFINTLKDILKVDNKVSFYRNAYALHIGKVKDVSRILDWIYSDAELFLERKHQRYLEMKNHLNSQGGL